MNPKRILLVDDERELTDMMAIRFESLGYAVDKAYDGSEGLVKMRQKKPDLVILDVMMPVMDGFEFYKAARKDPLLGKIPIIMLTARGAMKDAFESMSVEAFVPKPFNAEDLVARVKELLIDKALLLCDDEFVSGRVVAALKHIGFEASIVTDEDAMFKSAQEAQYKAIVIHLPLISTEPDDCVKRIRSTENNATPILVYSDSRVRGTEHNSTVAIDNLRIMWVRSDVEAFYDARVTAETFESFARERLRGR